MSLLQGKGGALQGDKKALQKAIEALGGRGSSGEGRDTDDHLAPLYDRKAIAAGAGKKSKQVQPPSDDEDDEEEEEEEEDDDEEDDIAAFVRSVDKKATKKGKGKEGKEGKKGKGKAAYGDFDADYDDADFAGASAGGEGRKRRRAPDGSMGDDGEDGDDLSSSLVEDFARKKKQYLTKKKEHYQPEKRFGGREDAMPASGKRAASYEIMKNRGLTPHRKKENRNPRVKKRHAYEKAIVRRKGQVREVIAGGAAAYGGEMTGIKANISRGRKIGN